MMRWSLPILLACVTGILAGCGPFRLPKAPKFIHRPTTQVIGVRLIDASTVAARFDIDVAVHNPNDVPLPLTFVRYKLEIGGAEYETDTLPKTTLPADGRITVTLPAVVLIDPAAAVEQGFATTGRFTITPEGEVRRLLYSLGFPKPKAPFEGQGAVGSVPSLSEARR